jgi:MarR family transcriptional regulator, organic hydroperoxide resistance regulator
MIRAKNILHKNMNGRGYPVRVSTAGQTARTADAVDDCGQAAACPPPANADRPDLTWLLHRAAQNMRIALDEAARAHGLTGARDWMVLSALSTGPRQTQLALAHSLGLDKTTMTALLDRMEARGLIVRRTDSHDRRARIPELTSGGRRVQAEVTSARDHVEASLLATFTPQEQQLLRELLARLAAAEPGECLKATGSCI